MATRRSLRRRAIHGLLANLLKINTKRSIEVAVLRLNNAILKDGHFGPESPEKKEDVRRGASLFVLAGGKGHALFPVRLCPFETCHCWKPVPKMEIANEEREVKLRCVTNRWGGL